MQPRQRDRVAPVRLDPLARPFRDQGRSDHHAIVAERLDLAIKPVSRRPGFKADMQPLVSVRQSLDRPLDRQRAVLDIAEKPDFSGPAPFRDRHRVLLLGDVESHKNFAILSHGPPSVHEARLGLPEQPSFLPARKGGPPAQPANMTSSRFLTASSLRNPARAAVVEPPFPVERLANYFVEIVALRFPAEQAFRSVRPRDQRRRVASTAGR